MVKIVREPEAFHLGLLEARESFRLSNRQFGPFVFEWMEELALEAFEAGCAFNARLSLVDQGVELLFFPPVGVLAFFKLIAAFLVASYECAWLPALT